MFNDNDMFNPFAYDEHEDISRVNFERAHFRCIITGASIEMMCLDPNSTGKDFGSTYIGEGQASEFGLIPGAYLVDYRRHVLLPIDRPDPPAGFYRGRNEGRYNENCSRIADYINYVIDKERSVVDIYKQKAERYDNLSSSGITRLMKF